MKVYKILHKPTGLYFTPSRGYGNFSKTGKIYTKPPRIEWAGTTVRIIIFFQGKKLNKKDQKIVDYFKIIPDEKLKMLWLDKYYTVPITDWEIIKL
jgi:hypothetical protein